KNPCTHLKSDRSIKTFRPLYLYHLYLQVCLTSCKQLITTVPSLLIPKPYADRPRKRTRNQYPTRLAQHRPQLVYQGPEGQNCTAGFLDIWLHQLPTYYARPEAARG